VSRQIFCKTKNTLPKRLKTESFFVSKLYCPQLLISIGDYIMFCPFCGKQNKDNVPFCAFCGKALPLKSSAPPVTQPVAMTNLSPQKASAPKRGLSYNAKRGIITGLLIAVIVIVILVIYYPSIFPWGR
jgi:hypothetical protein